MSEQHWAVKKEINLANIFTTLTAILGGVWWVASFEGKVDAADANLQKQIELIEADRKHDKKDILQNKETAQKMEQHLRSIDDKMGILIFEFKHYQNQHDKNGDK